MKFSFNLLRDLDFYYLNATSEFKLKILGSIFPENLVYLDKNYRTPNSDSVISLIANIAEVSGGTKIQKVTNNDDQSLSAPRVTRLSNSFLSQLKEIYKLKPFLNVGESRITG